MHFVQLTDTNVYDTQQEDPTQHSKEDDAIAKRHAALPLQISEGSKSRGILPAFLAPKKNLSLWPSLEGVVRRSQTVSARPEPEHKHHIPVP